jgi:metal-sulfur cluster biosynthetic enzyme
MAATPTRIIDALRTVYDPCCREKGISVVDMGLVREVAVDGDNASVQLILTTGWCPFAAHLLSTITERIEALPEVGTASVEVTWDEAWTTERLSDEARATLRFLPDPRSVPDRDAILESARESIRRKGARP